MIFNYRYVPHTIETLQTWLDHLVKNVWCRNSGAYSLDLLLPEFRAVVEEIANDERVITDHFDGPIRAIDELFQNKLTLAERIQIATWYDNNNNIEQVCANAPDKRPATYADIKAINEGLAESLAVFCKNLWNRILGLAAVEKRIGSVDDHYRDAFLTLNKQDRCPYCGYQPTMGEYLSFRDAYDHFLPKDTYPFNTVNFRNLAPICHRCNSTYKLQRDPTRVLDPATRQNLPQRTKAFFSYAAEPSGITLSVTLNTDDLENLHPSEIDLQIDSSGRGEEVDSWKGIFGIEERYKAKCCGANDGRAWIEQALDECRNVGLTAEELLENIKDYACKRPLHDCNFLKAPFLQACCEAGFIP